MTMDALACDAHMHIVGPFARYPLRETRSLNPPEATLDDYRRVRDRLGLGRCVIVQPSVFAKDNACTLDAVEALEGSARAVVVVDADTDETTLECMHRRGARGVRLQQVVAGGASLDELEELAARIQPFGWHVQLFVDAAQLTDLVPRIRRLPVNVVFDHMAQTTQAAGMESTGFEALLQMLQTGKVWVKLANAFGFPDAARARSLIAANRERVVWGTDWPHLGVKGAALDDGKLLEALGEWTQDEALRQQILVDNPDRLYFR